MGEVGVEIPSEIEAWWSLARDSAASPGHGEETARLVSLLMDGGWALNSRRGMVVSIFDATPAPRPAALRELRPVNDLRSVSLMDLAAVSDQPEVVEMCLAKASPEKWGASVISTFAGVCASRGAHASLDVLLENKAAAAMVARKGYDCSWSGEMLGVGFLCEPFGRSALERVMEAAGKDDFKSWLTPNGKGFDWQSVLIERAWCSGLAHPLLTPWSRQARGMEPESMWAYAIGSARLVDLFDKLPTLEREAREARSKMAVWGAYMRGAIMAAGFEGRQVDPAEARALASQLREHRVEQPEIAAYAPVILDALAERSELESGCLKPLGPHAIPHAPRL